MNFFIHFLHNLKIEIYDKHILSLKFSIIFFKFYRHFYCLNKIFKFVYKFFTFSRKQNFLTRIHFFKNFRLFTNFFTFHQKLYCLINCLHIFIKTKIFEKMQMFLQFSTIYHFFDVSWKFLSLHQNFYIFHKFFTYPQKRNILLKVTFC